MQASKITALSKDERIVNSGTILCKQTGVATDYAITVGLEPSLLIKMEAAWSHEKAQALREALKDRPEIATDRNAFVAALDDYGLTDFHWNWVNKATALNSDEYEWFFLTAEDNVQAVCIIFHPKESRIDGLNIFYIDYIASAYWNRARPDYEKRFSGVGRILLRYSIHHSVNILGYRPGFCLHSLPTAEYFYKHIGMTEYESDPDKENLKYFEADETVSRLILESA